MNSHGRHCHSVFEQKKNEEEKIRAGETDTDQRKKSSLLYNVEISDIYTSLSTCTMKAKKNKNMTQINP